MGIAKAITRISTSVQNAVNNMSQANATATCILTIDSLTTGNLLYCSIIIYSKCYAEAESTMDVIVEAASQSFTEIDQEATQVASGVLSPRLGRAVTETNIKESVSNYLRNGCESSANTYSLTDVGQVNLGDCTGSPTEPTKITFTSTGQGKSICVMNSLTTLLTAMSNDVSQSASSTSSGLISAQIVYLVLIGVIVVSALVLIYYIAIHILSKPSDKYMDRLERYARNARIYHRNNVKKVHNTHHEVNHAQPPVKPKSSVDVSSIAKTIQPLTDAAIKSSAKYITSMTSPTVL